MTLSTYKPRKEGIGSFFNQINKNDFNFNAIDIPFEYQLFYTGRHAIKYILDTICSERNIEKIWIPNYYCQHVTEWLKKIYKNLHFYDISPYEFSTTLNINSIASNKDVILLNNYWGLSSSTKKHPKNPVIIEDHSHGWLSKNSLQSNADYCFASLRKSLPIPLGGISWIPNSKIADKPDLFIKDKLFYNNWDKIAQAMNSKTHYINNTSQINKSDYLTAITDTEHFLNNHFDLVKMRKKDQHIIEDYIDINFIEKKESNLNIIYENLHGFEFMKIIKREGYTTFGLCLLFKHKHYWNSLRTYLISHDIYPSYLWPDNKPVYEWNYFLNIHVDFRYNKSDMIFIADKINNWIKTMKTN